MLSKPPTTTPAATLFAFAGNNAVRLAPNMMCPYCGRFLHAYDVEVTPAAISIICGGAGCHRDLLVITEATSTEATS